MDWNCCRGATEHTEPHTLFCCRFSLYEPIEFIKTHLKDKLEWSQVRDSVAIHVPCSSKKLGISSAFEELAGLCAKEVTPSNIPCCGKFSRHWSKGEACAEVSSFMDCICIGFVAKPGSHLEYTSHCHPKHWWLDNVRLLRHAMKGSFDLWSRLCWDELVWTLTNACQWWLCVYIMMKATCITHLIEFASAEISEEECLQEWLAIVEWDTQNWLPLPFSIWICQRIARMVTAVVGPVRWACPTTLASTSGAWSIL